VSLVNSACRLTGHDALAIGPEESARRRRVVDHTVSLLPALSRPPKAQAAPRHQASGSAATG
jgi:hypothetical protein